MARTRNPRYATEFLERRLHPTVMIPLAAEVACISMDDPEPLPPDEPGSAPRCPRRRSRSRPCPTEHGRRSAVTVRRSHPARPSRSGGRAGGADIRKDEAIRSRSRVEELVAREQLVEESPDPTRAALSGGPRRQGGGGVGRGVACQGASQGVARFGDERATRPPRRAAASRRAPAPSRRSPAPPLRAPLRRRWSTTK